ncbi:MAG: hypothetical protein KGL31_05375 [candidate division NC10 bacterium]|nr:hypothetical protein [candidate division NC10 bacterium]MDE2321335.1 hypothetical protein [candidate division NC10 bacterium]
MDPVNTCSPIGTTYLRGAAALVDILLGTVGDGDLSTTQPLHRLCREAKDRHIRKAKLSNHVANDLEVGFIELAFIFRLRSFIVIGTDQRLTDVDGVQSLSP